MATSRVGGTKGLLNGQVGSDIYQIRNNGNGTYTQIVYAKGVRTETTFSPKLQAQRMCTGMVQSLMKQLKPVVSLSFEAGRNKTASCNSFSAANIRLVQRDCMDHWDGHNRFVFPIQRKGYPDFSELGGPYMISSGSLKKNLFDAIEAEEYARPYWKDLPYAEAKLYGLVFNINIGVDTLNDFRNSHAITMLDKFFFVAFREWVSYEPDPDDPQQYSQHTYLIAQLDRKLSSDTVLTEDVIKNMFVVNSNYTAGVFIARDGKRACVGLCCNPAGTDDQMFYWAGFCESHAGGKKKISTSYYTNDVNPDEPYMLNRQPSMVFGSWMGEPSVRPYPSPF